MKRKKTDGAKTPPRCYARPAWQRTGTLFVLGIDGMTLDVIKPMIEAGELPGFARLADEGCSGRLKTVWPTNSSLLWTSIATGRHHRDHGVDHFQHYTVLGKMFSHYDLRKGGWAIKRFLRTAKMLGLLRMGLFDGRHVRAKPFWEAMSEGGASAVVVNWWHTWPAVPLNGCVASDRVLYWRELTDRQSAPVGTRLTFPEELSDELRPLMVSPDDITLEELQRYVNLPEKQLRELTTADFQMNVVKGELRFFISEDRSCERFANHCLQAWPEPTVAAMYFRSPDVAQHCAFQYTPWARPGDATPLEKEQFGNVVPQTYRDADALLGRLMARMSPEDTLLLLSDHGVTFVDERRGYCHRYGEPPGVIYAWGKEFRCGYAVSPPPAKWSDHRWRPS